MLSISYLKSIITAYWSKFNLFTEKIFNFFYNVIEFNEDYEKNLMLKYSGIFSPQKYDWDCGIACLEMVIIINRNLF